MTIPMNNTLGNSSRERAQHLYTKIAELKNKCRKAAQSKDPNAWQQMRDTYESIILEDHECSEQYDIECALWQLHYKRIEEFRAYYNTAQASAAQTAKEPVCPGPDRITKIRSQLKTFLSDATEFYLDLMVKIRAKYGLSLDHTLDDSQNNTDRNKSIDVKKGTMTCHRCCIYLGDLARYKGLYGEGDSKLREFAAASSYYKQAATLWPSSGNPHNQLAILASYSGDELLTVYHYFRSLAVDPPFVTARDNLIIAFEKNRQNYCQLLGDLKPNPTKKAPSRMNGRGRNRGDTRVSLKDRKIEPTIVEDKEPSVTRTLQTFCTQFVRLIGILFTRTSLETFEEVFSFARSNFLQLLCSGCDEVLCFGSDFNECKLFIIRLTVVMIFTVYNANKETENQSCAEIQRSVVLQNALTALFDFMALIIDRCCQLDDSSGSFLLPGVMIFVEWMDCCQDVVTNELKEKQAIAKSLFWNHFASFLNKIVSSGSSVVTESDDNTCLYNTTKYDEAETANRLALPEDFELRGFLPLVTTHLILDFSRKKYFGGDGTNEKIARVRRIITAGKALTTNLQVGQQGIYFDSKSKKFFFGVKPPNANEVSVINGESEEEDEVIVFKPSVPEKHSDGFPSKLTSSDCIVDNGTDSFMSHGGFPLDPPASTLDGNMQHLQFVQPNTSKRMGGEDLIENGISNINLFGNGSHTKLDRQVSLGILKPEGFGSFRGHLFQDSEAEIPSKFDSVMASAAPDFDSIPSKTKFHKSPVSRPVRHFGPPPGFNTSVRKYTNEPLPNGNLKGTQNLSPALDDYSWLDGYRLPYSACSEGFGNSFNCLPQPNKLLNMHKTSLGMENFPFPGKQVSSVPDGIGNGMQNGWLEYQSPEHSSLYQEPVKKGNEQYIAVSQQYQGQSLWEGRFFV